MTEVAAIACGAHVIASSEYHPDLGMGGLHERERKRKIGKTEREEKNRGGEKVSRSNLFCCRN